MAEVAAAAVVVVAVADDGGGDATCVRRSRPCCHLQGLPRSVADSVNCTLTHRSETPVFDRNGSRSSA